MDDAATCSSCDIRSKIGAQSKPQSDSRGRRVLGCGVADHSRSGWHEVWHRAGRILDVRFEAWLGQYVRF